MKQNLTKRRTAKYWLIAPMKADSKLFETAWKYDKLHGIITASGCCDSIALQNVSQFANYDEFQTERRKINPNWLRHWPKAIWDFHRNIQKNDVIIARHGKTKILGVGIVKGAAYYNFTKGEKRIRVSSLEAGLEAGEFETDIQPRFIEVFWTITGKFEVKKQKLVSSLVQEIDRARYQKLLGALEGVKDTQYQNIYETLELDSEVSRRGHKTKDKQTSTQKQNPNYYIGIDLGTTNSIMAWGSVNPRTKIFEPKTVPVDMVTEREEMRRNPFLPSYVYFEKGQPSIVGEYAQKMLQRQPDRVVKSIKKVVGSRKQFNFDDITYSPTEISAQILRHLAASAKLHFGFIPDEIIITVPAYFDSNMRTATIKAAELAGFRTTDLLLEPQAILLNYINQENRGETAKLITNSHEPKFVLIFDLGGGPLKVSLYQVFLHAEQNVLYIEDLAISDYTELGGGHFDELLADHFLDIYFKKSLANSFDDYVNDLEYVEGFSTSLLADIKDNFREYILNFRQIEKKLSLNWNDFLKHSRRNTNLYLSGFQINQLKNIFLQYIEQAKNEFPLNLDKDQNDLLKNVFRQYAEQAKIELSEQIAFAKKFGTWDEATSRDRFGIPTIIRKPFADKEFRLDLTLNEYERIIQSFLAPSMTLDDVNQLDTLEDNNIIYPILDVLRKVRKKKGTLPQVDAVLLNGGMTKLHTIQKRLETFFGLSPLVPQDDAVARGAVIHHHKLCMKNLNRGLEQPQHIFFQSQDILNKTAPTENYVKPEVNTSRNLNVKSEIAELAANLKQLSETNDLKIRKVILDRIKTQETRIVQNSKANEFVPLLCESIPTLNNFGKMLTVNLLGNIGAICSDKDLRARIYEAAIELLTLEKIKANGRAYANSVARSAVEAIGKTGLSLAKSALFDLLNLGETSTIRSTIIHSIGKCCDSIDAVEVLKSLIESGEDKDQTAATWSFGQIGRREMEAPLKIQELMPVVTSLMEQLNTDCHDDIKRNCIYALAEICDRRKCANNVVNIGTAVEVILQLVNFLIEQVDVASSKSNSKLREVTVLAIQMIRGIDLSPDEKKSLYAIRQQN